MPLSVDDVISFPVNQFRITNIISWTMFTQLTFHHRLLWVLLDFDNLVHGFLGNFPQVDRFGGSDQFFNLLPVGWGVRTPNFLDLNIVGVWRIEDRASGTGFSHCNCSNYQSEVIIRITFHTNDARNQVPFVSHQKTTSIWS